MEPWQIAALQALLTTEIKQVEETRVYTSSPIYGDSRFHLLSKRTDSIQIEQTTIDDKWSSRITFQADELPAVLKTLFTWYLEDIQHELTLAPAADGGIPLDNLDDSLF